jgi:hypothetical protein
MIILKAKEGENKSIATKNPGLSDGIKVLAIVTLGATIGIVGSNLEPALADDESIYNDELDASDQTQVIDQIGSFANDPLTVESDNVLGNE